MSETKKLRKVPPEAFRRQLLAILPVFLNTFIIGNTIGWIPNAIYLFNKGDPQPFTALECSIIASSSEIGCTLFSLPVGYITDRIGRKTMMIISGIANLLASIILSFFPTYTSIIIARFLLGIGLILAQSISSAAIGELASPEIRAKIISIDLLFLSLGQIFPSLINIFFSSYRIISYCSTLISALYFLSLYFSIETPYFLVSKSRYEEAKDNLRKIRIGYSENEIGQEFENFKKYIEDEKKHKQELNWWIFFSSRTIMRPLLITILVHHFVLATGYFVMTIYITTIIPNNIELIPKRFYPFIVQSLRIVAGLCTPFFIELFPRRVAYLGVTICTLLNFAIILIAYYCFVALSMKFCQLIFVFCVILFLGIGANFLLSAIVTMRGELLPQTIKGIGSSICVMIQSSTTALYLHLYRFVTENYDLYWIFLIFSINTLIVFFIFYFLLPETRGKLLADIQVKQNEEVCVVTPLVAVACTEP